MSNGGAALHVKESLAKNRWVFPPVETDAVARIASMHNLPEFIARLLHARGVKAEEVEAFLYPTLRSHFPDPFSLAGMEALAVDVAKAIQTGRSIGVFADFDVDGATSAAILIRFLRHFEINAPLYIPDRLSEGYGPSREALLNLKDRGAEFILMADCGITAFEAVASGREMGLDIAVLDHHEAEDTLPNATHIINPKRKDDTSGLTMLAACGVSFMVCVAVNNVLKREGYYTKTGLAEPPLKSWLDLVALGTVCDMVPMIGINRLFVRSGFEQMAAFNNPGIKALCTVGNVQSAPDPTHAGFVLGPRINAGSRVHRSDLGARLLATDNHEEAQSLAWTLEDCNKQRREIQSVMVDQAMRRVEMEGLGADPVIVIGDPDWHPGLAGLVAGRLKDRFGKPAVVITYAANPLGVLEGRGSGRSVRGVNIANAFIDARNEGLLTKGGGHAMAGGFTLDPACFPAFREFMIEHIKKQLEHIDLTQEIQIDGIASIQAAEPGMIRIVTRHVGPFGVGHPEPVFALANVRLHMVDVLKDKHIRAHVSDWEGGKRIKTMLFNGVGTPLGDAMLKRHNQPFHLAGQFQINSWQGRESVEFHISDGALVLAESPVEAAFSDAEIPPLHFHKTGS